VDRRDAQRANAAHRVSVPEGDVHRELINMVHCHTAFTSKEMKRRKEFLLSPFSFPISKDRIAVRQ
jgi:hypothetical protein